MAALSGQKGMWRGASLCYDPHHLHSESHDELEHLESATTAFKGSSYFKRLLSSFVDRTKVGLSMLNIIARIVFVCNRLLFLHLNAG